MKKKYLHVRIEPGLHKNLKLVAINENVTVQDLIEKILNQWAKEYAKPA